TYVDGLITGANTVDDTLDLQLLLNRSGFEFRKWSFNCNQLLRVLLQDHRQNPVSLEEFQQPHVSILQVQLPHISRSFEFYLPLHPELHAFSDASDSEFVAEMYFRSPMSSGEVLFGAKKECSTKLRHLTSFVDAKGVLQVGLGCDSSRLICQNLSIGVIRSRICKCVRYFKTKPRNISPLMGELSTSRVRPSCTFLPTCLDYAGNFTVQVFNLRAERHIKQLKLLLPLSPAVCHVMDSLILLSSLKNLKVRFINSRRLKESNSISTLLLSSIKAAFGNTQSKAGNFIFADSSHSSQNMKRCSTLALLHHSLVILRISEHSPLDSSGDHLPAQPLETLAVRPSPSLASLAKVADGISAYSPTTVQVDVLIHTTSPTLTWLLARVTAMDPGQTALDTWLLLRLTPSGRLQCPLRENQLIKSKFITVNPPPIGRSSGSYTWFRSPH
ncbi:hypothetical protein J6590_074190, partial [Homalodisca vitripennis]